MSLSVPFVTFVSPCVSCVFLFCYPPTIFGGIALVVVYSVNLQTFFVSVFNRPTSESATIVKPFFANANPATAVSVIAFAILVITSLFDAVPKNL